MYDSFPFLGLFFCFFGRLSRPVFFYLFSDRPKSSQVEYFNKFYLGRPKRILLRFLGLFNYSTFLTSPRNLWEQSQYSQTQLLRLHLSLPINYEAPPGAAASKGARLIHSRPMYEAFILASLSPGFSAAASSLYLPC